MMRGGSQLINQIQSRQTRMESDRKSWCRPRRRTNRGKKIVWSQSFWRSQKVESNSDSRKSNFLSAVRNILVENNPFCQIISTLERQLQLCWTGLIKIKCEAEKLGNACNVNQNWPTSFWILICQVKLDKRNTVDGWIEVLKMHKFYWKNLDRPPRRSQV